MKMNKKTVLYNGIICIILEVVLFLLLGKSGAVFTMLIGAIAIPVVILLINIMFFSIENALLVFIFAIPLLPISGYIMNRLNLLSLQWAVYLLFYILTTIALMYNGLFKKIDLKNIIIKDKIIRGLLLVLLIANIIFAYNKTLTFMIIALSFIPFILYFIIIKAVKLNNKKDFYNKVLVAFTVGCIASSLPDVIIFIYTWISGNKSIRLFGPLGSNFILIYDLLLYVIVIAKWVKNKEIKSYWTILVISLSIIISMQMSRGALISFVAIIITYLIFNPSNWKKYISIGLIFGTILTANVFSRKDVSSDESLKELGEAITSTEDGDATNIALGEDGLSKIIMKIIDSQSRTRQVIWKTGIAVSKDYPTTGVGLGNFKYFFNEYSGTKKDYSDAHNLYLNMSSELGTPFMLLGLLLHIIIGVGSLIKFFMEKDKNKKNNYLSLMIIAGVVLVYGNFTGLAFQTTNLIYSFTPTFIILFVLFYRDYIQEF